MTRGLPPAQGQEEAVRRLARMSARTIVLAGSTTTVVCVVVAVVLAGRPGLLGAALGGTLAVAASLITPLTMRRTATASPQLVMLASFLSMALKALLMLAVLLTVGGSPSLHRMSLAVTMLVVLLVTTAAGAVVGRRLPVLLGAEPKSGP